MNRLSRRRGTKRRLVTAVVGVLLVPLGVHVSAADPSPQVMAGGDLGVVTQTPGGPIVEATGSFDSTDMKNVDSVRSPVPGKAEPETVDAYTLQLNTNEFATPLCAGAAAPDLCKGWQQFIFANNGSAGELYIKYWLLQYGEPCPAGWTGSFGHCFQKRGLAMAIPNMPLGAGEMKYYRLTGRVDGANDVITFTNKKTNTVYTTSIAREIAIGSEWKQAEFNVYGYAEASMARFNEGAEFLTRTEIMYGGMNKPICVSKGFSTEFNNLSFVEPPLSASWTVPAYLFRQRMVADGAPVARVPCRSGLALGDTHERTFAGTSYDFQATGDFVEAQVGSAFEVQTRKASGAPAWPEASVNRSVATRMGNTQVAVCDGTRLMVDGRPTSLGSGGSLSLPTGVNIRRDGDMYVVADQSGNSVNVTTHPGSATIYSDLDVSLGTWPTAVRGLLGNPDNDPTWLEGRDGTRFRAPVPFADLYNRFGNSWRVASTVSLLRPCSPVAASNPSALFFAGNLDRRRYDVAKDVCDRAGVTAKWLEACILDVAVLGTRAAAVFVGRQQPLVDANPPHRQEPPPCSPAGCGGR